METLELICTGAAIIIGIMVLLWAMRLAIDWAREMIDRDISRWER